MRTLVWFRGKDLRIGDHAPLRDAVAAGEVVPLFVLDPYFFAPARARELPHRIQFLLSSLRALEANLADRGSRLSVVAGRSVDVVPGLARRWRVDRVVGHRWVEPIGRERDRRIAASCPVPFDLYEGETLLPPGTLRTSQDQPYTVFTPFARAFRAGAVIDAPLPAPRSLPPLPPDVGGETAPIPTPEDLGLTANPRLLEGGERAARVRLRRFLAGPAASYREARNRLDLEGTSRLSADLKFGTLSIRQAWAASEGLDTFRSELLWREFAYSTLWDRPELLEQPFRPNFRDFPWENDEAHWRAWVDGTTGYPVVDAAARQLLAEGFVHNRARMIAASFLTKHLLVDYRWGEAHYLKFLADGDWASNNFGWQWATGCGCDSLPYFRIFNPVLQGARFDPQGDYVRRWVPELAHLSAEWIHRPWEGPQRAPDYPPPIVDHHEARARFLAAAKGHLGRAIQR
jgi:deoxyribodipyrimidine photo-lyase